MFNFNNIRSIAAVALASASLLTSCVGLEEDSNDAVGYLDVPALEVDLAVDDLLLTKALDFKVNEPSVSDVHFVVKDKNGTVRYDGNGLWEEPLVLPVGSYSVEASYGSNGFGAPYFTGSAEGSIGHLDKVTPELTMKLSNSLVKVSVASSLEGHFTPGNEVSFKFNDRAHTAGYNTWTYVPAGQDISVTLALAGTTSAGTPANFTHTLSNPSPKVAYDVVCGKTETNWPEITMSDISPEDAWASCIYISEAASFTDNISDDNKAKVIYEAIPSSSSDWTSALSSVPGEPVIKGLTPGKEYQVRARVGGLISENVAKVTPQLDGLSVSAAHTYTSGELDGTDVQTTFTKSELVKNAISSWSVNICKADGTVLRDVQSSLGTSDGSLITATDGWPYLPAGSYKVMATATMDGTTYEVESAFSVSTPGFTPIIELANTSYTSYDKYCNGEIGAANGCAPESLYHPEAIIGGISDNLKKNSNYPKEVSFFVSTMTQPMTKTVYSMSEESIIGDDITSLTWGSHTLTAQFTFDGVSSEVSAGKTHHITGLPYTLSHPAQGWSIVENGVVNYIRFTDQYIFLTSDSSTGSVKTPNFNIPGNTNVSVSTTFKRIRDGILTDWTFSVHTYDNSGQTSEIDSHKGNGKNTVHTIGGDATLTPSCYNILCRRYYWGGSGPDAQITDFSIVYRN